MAWSRAAFVVVLFGVALSLRLYEIERESFWIDEALTLFLSDHSIGEVLARDANDVHPPLYYLGIHFWRKAFGDRDGFLRGYSTLWSLIGLAALWILARDIGGWRAGLIALGLGALNPFWIYYAQEARNYAQATALLTLAAWCLWRWISAATVRDRWWPWAAVYGACAAAVLYTHYISAMILTAQGLFALAWFGWNRRWWSLGGLAAATAGVALLFLPWLLYVYRFRPTLYHSDLSWIQTPPLIDYYGFLGWEFFWGACRTIGYSGWLLGMGLALLVIGVSLARALWINVAPGEPSLALGRTGTVYLLWLIAGPLLITAVTGAIYHPVYSRFKFAIFLLPPFLAMAGLACAASQRRAIGFLCAGALAAVMLRGTFLQAQTQQKCDWRVFAKVWKERGPGGLTFFFPPMSELTPAHYVDVPLVTLPRREVERYLPHLNGKDLWICWTPPHDFRHVRGEFDYYQWLVGLGTVRVLQLPGSAFVQVVTAGRTYGPECTRPDRWFAPFDIPTWVAGFDDPTQFSPILEMDDRTSVTFRWSGPRARICFQDSESACEVVLNVQLPPPVVPNYAPGLRFYTHRGADDMGLFESKPVARVEEYRAGAFEVRLPAPNGAGDLWVGWRMNAVNLKQAGISQDDRNLGLRINWVGLLK